MMNRTQFLLIKVTEEAVETAQRALKASYFGLDQVQVGQPLNNRQRLVYEFNDLIAVMRMLHIRTEPDEKMIAEKIEKLKGYMALSIELGELEPQADLAGVKVAERDNYLGIPPADLRPTMKDRHLPDASHCEAKGKCSQAVPHS